MITNTLIDSKDQEQFQIIKAFDITINLIKNHLRVHKEHMNGRIISFLTSELSELKNQRTLELEKINRSKS